MKRIAIGISLMMSVSLAHAMDGRSYAEVVRAAEGKPPQFVAIAELPVVAFWAPAPRVQSVLGNLRAIERKLSSRANAIERDLVSRRRLLEVNPRACGIQLSVDALQQALDEIVDELSDIQRQIEAVQAGDAPMDFDVSDGSGDEIE